MRPILPVLLASPLLCYAQTRLDTWHVTGGGPENLHYSSLRQINRLNVHSLQIAWTYRSGDEYPDSDIQCNPIIVGRNMYITTPKLRVVKLDALTGKQLWSFDARHLDRAPHPNRGVTYWSDGRQSRVLFTIEHFLYSIDAESGQPDPQFGTNGVVDLRDAFSQPRDEVSLTVTSPGVVYQDLIILGSSVAENLPATSGDIRAYDVKSGRLRWTFHTIPHPGEFGADTWPPDAYKHSGAANNWAGMAVDEKHGLVFAPTGSAAFDFYGADRHGDNLFSDTMLCLDARTGQRRWHFQAIRHDVWDLDFPSAPLLIKCRHEGKLVDAVAQAGKNGYIYVLNRETGETLFPLKEHPIPRSDVDGELLAPSQLLPEKPAPFVRQAFTEETVTNRTPAAHDAVLQRLRSMVHGVLFQPPSLRGTVMFPGLAGGAEWGGSAFDPETHVYYVNANELAWIVRLIPPEAEHRTAKVSRVYRVRCASCHGFDRKGAPPEYPALNALNGKRTAAQIMTTLRSGSGRMPSFATLGDPALDAIVQFLLNGEDKEIEVKRTAQPLLRYTVDGYRKFLDPDGYPANSPPWGTLSAINLDTGNYLWQIPLGEYPELVAKGLTNTGSENHGGGVVTAGGLLFIGATHYDNKFRAFDKQTGKLLWETVLPNAANATPAIFEIDGREFVVVAAGGGRGRPSGSSFIAFSLPQSGNPTSEQ